MRIGGTRPLWPELLIAVLGLILVIAAPIRAGWVGAVVIVMSIVSALAAPLLLRHSRNAQIVGFVVGVLAIVAGLLIAQTGGGDPEIFSPALIWVIGAGLVMSTLINLAAERLRGNDEGMG